MKSDPQGHDIENNSPRIHAIDDKSNFDVVSSTDAYLDNSACLASDSLLRNIDAGMRLVDSNDRPQQPDTPLKVANDSKITWSTMMDESCDDVSHYSLLIIC